MRYQQPCAIESKTRESLRPLLLPAGIRYSRYQTEVDKPKEMHLRSWVYGIAMVFICFIGCFEITW